MSAVGRPLRFLMVVLTGWTGARAALLWSEPELAGPARATASSLAAADRPVLVPMRGAIAGSRAARPAGSIAAANRTSEQASLAPVLPSLATLPPTIRAIPAPGQPERTQAAPIEPALAMVAAAPHERRWSISAWLVARGGSMAGGGPFGPVQLGGSQAGARLRYALSRTLALSGRLSAPLRGIGREGALGLEWRPVKLPVSILLERRIALDAGHGGTALGAIAGINPTRVAGRLELEGYGQAGVVARARREPFADGAVRLLHPVAESRHARLALGAGMWGGAQRGATRLDVGPSLVATVPTGGPTLRVAAEWRQRVAGNAAPGSGPAVTVGTDF